MRNSAMLLALMAAFTAASLRANLIENGSFETTTTPIPSGSFSNFLPGSTGLTDWTIVGVSGTEVSAVNTTFVQECCSFLAEDGTNWLDLTGLNTNNDTEGVSQTVATTVGDSYTLSFFVGNVSDPNGLFGTASTVDISENGISLGAFTNSCSTCTRQLTWQELTATFTATSASTTLVFRNGDPGTDNSNGLDNISLVDSGRAAAVPEPSAIGLLCLCCGVLALAGFARRSSERESR